MQRLIKGTFLSILALCILANIIAAIQAYKFTHFINSNVVKTKSSDSFSFLKKMQIALLGINNPRPVNKELPKEKYSLVKIQSNKILECWKLRATMASGTVILFHGYGGDKSSMLDKAEAFNTMGFNVFLVDFMGSGGSEGNQTTVGYKEAEEVKDCFAYVKSSGEKNIYLFGASMGAVAILKAIAEYKVNPTGIIVECPYGSMYQTVCNRFKSMDIPVFPMAGLLAFWGGIENGFWAFSLNPVEYAKSVKCPTLLMYGAKDKKVTRHETDEIYGNLTCKKHLHVFPNAGHENYLAKNYLDWRIAVDSFINKITPRDSMDFSVDTMDIPFYKPVWGYRFVIRGDFNGDGKKEILTEHYYNSLRHKETNKFFDSLEYMKMISLAFEQKPWSFVTSSNPEIDTLQISREPYLFGIAWMKNEGDLLGDGKDEISYVVNWADVSSLNTCYIVTYTKKGWKELYHFEVHDWEIPIYRNTR